jgi:hypothetical protein
MYDVCINSELHIPIYTSQLYIFSNVKTVNPIEDFFKLMSCVIIISVSEIMSPEDEMQFWSNFANSVGRQDEKEKGTAFWCALEPLVKDFRHASMCNLE